MIDPAYLERIGVYQDPVDRQYKRHRIRNTNFEYDPSDPKAVALGKLVSYDEQLVPHPVVLALATDPASIEEARAKAVASGADFYHPDHGWLRWGRKREVERPENLGAGVVRYQSRKVVVAPQSELPGVPPGLRPDDGAPLASPVPEPVPEPTPTPTPTPTPALRAMSGRSQGDSR